MTLYGYMFYESMAMLGVGDDKSTVLAGKVNSPQGRCFNIKTPSYQYMNSHHRDKRVSRPSHLHNGNHYSGNTASYY